MKKLVISMNSMKEVIEFVKAMPENMIVVVEFIEEDDEDGK